jgi:hypothetical protein
MGSARKEVEEIVAGHEQGGIGDNGEGCVVRAEIVERVIQCCPTFLYIGAHLTDGCGGAGALWRLQ